MKLAGFLVAVLALAAVVSSSPYEVLSTADVTYSEPWYKYWLTCYDRSCSPNYGPLCAFCDNLPPFSVPDDCFLNTFVCYNRLYCRYRVGLCISHDDDYDWSDWLTYYKK